MSSPYPRFPTIHGDTIVFTAQDDLWTVPVEGGRATRLTNGAAAALPSFSPDGTRLAYISAAHGAPELHVLDLASGRTRQLTWQGAPILTTAWSPDGRFVRYASAAGSVREPLLWEAPADGGSPRRRPEVSGATVASAEGGPSLVFRNWADPAHWKRYRGGTQGAIWWDEHGTGEYRRILTELNGNLTAPRIALGRLFFISDHEGVGNVYSVAFDTTDLRRHSDHDVFYARNLGSSDGERLVYHAAAELYLLDSADADSRPRRVEVSVETPHAALAETFVPAAPFTQTAALSPDGSRVAITARGKAFSLDVGKGPVRRHGDPGLTRYRLLKYLDGERLVGLASDDGPEERLVVLDGEGERRFDLDLGAVLEFAVAPGGGAVAVVNQRYELIHVDLAEGTSRVLDRGDDGALLDAVYSPDGSWIAYRFPEEGTDPEGEGRASLRLVNVDSGECAAVAERVLHDFRPSFDPEGNYLYFVGFRDFDGVYDATHLDLAFLKGSRPYAVELRPGLGSPFEDGEREGEGVVLDGITRRIHRFDVPDGRYKRVVGLPGRRALLLSGVSSGQLDRRQPLGKVTDTLEVFDFSTAQTTRIAGDVADVWLSADLSTMIYRSGDSWRVLPAGRAPDGDEGRLDLDRVKVRVRPAEEWRQILREAWRAQRDHFWTADMSGIDWDDAWARYEPLLSTVASRRELADLLLDLQGELGTSHTYHEFVPPVPSDRRSTGLLGADLVLDEGTGTWRVTALIEGDRWNPEATSPLHLAGIAEDEEILAVNGREVDPRTGPGPELVNQAGSPVELTVRGSGGQVRTVTVTPIGDEYAGRYRDWVALNRAKVHEATGGRVGYVHSPGMMTAGYGEFMRSYLAEYGREALIVDARNNSGGHLSPLVLEKLVRRRIGQVHWRPGRTQPYPLESPRGPLVGLVNEYCGSDGDMFAQGFRMFGLGPLVGTRTWGGVIGGLRKQLFADNSNTFQPMMAISFDDVSWGVENYGVDPDVHVERSPQDYAAGRDPQLDTAIELALTELDKRPAHEHRAAPKPNLARPALPPRP
ncbi:PDZ domain-containing protein [Phytomonospora sp. NPDC050363]|uniref:S41 family peptidase n=1 Tax=Phytomonospora sp. NPDC050363 TaxID=3155642 RepID=UPI0033DA7A15